MFNFLTQKNLTETQKYQLLTLSIFSLSILTILTLLYYIKKIKEDPLYIEKIAFTGYPRDEEYYEKNKFQMNVLQKENTELKRWIRKRLPGWDGQETYMGDPFTVTQ